ncbi:hypothetical protein ACWIGI_09990 [Nocardia sp. NPDC055321]
MLLVASQGIAAAAPGQPGLAVPGEGQPGLSTVPEPPAVNTAPSPADWIPDPPVAPPNRPRPQQQTRPNIDTLVQPENQIESAPEEETVAPNDQAAVMPSDPHQLRVGRNTVQLPDFIDLKSRNKAQAYLDMAEWQIAAAYDRMGFSREDSDRMAASSTVGALVGVGAAAVAPLALVPAGCAVGAVVGGIAGGAIGGLPTAGIGAPAGAIIGGAGGCVIGGSLGGLVSGPIVIGGATLAAFAGNWLSGGDANQPAPPDPNLVEVAAPVEPAVQPVSAPVLAAPVIPDYVPPAVAEPVAQAVAPVVQQVNTVVDQVADQVNQAVDQTVATVDSLRSAVAQMPVLTPEAFLASIQQPAPGV